MAVVEIVVRFEIPQAALELIAELVRAARQGSPQYGRPSGHADPPVQPPSTEAPSGSGKRRRGRPRKGGSRPGPPAPPEPAGPVTLDDLRAAFDFLLHQPEGEFRILQVFSQFSIGSIHDAKPNQYGALFNALRLAASAEIPSAE